MCLGSQSRSSRISHILTTNLIRPQSERHPAHTSPSPMAAHLSVTVPEGSRPGDRIALTLPDGRQIQVQVPPGISSGKTFFCQIANDLTTPERTAGDGISVVQGVSIPEGDSASRQTNASHAQKVAHAQPELQPAVAVVQPVPSPCTTTPEVVPFPEEMRGGSPGMYQCYSATSSSRVPVIATCSSCGQTALTTTQFVPGLGTYLSCTGICLVGGWMGCCFIPFCVDPLKDVKHSCSNCGVALGQAQLIGK